MILTDPNADFSRIIITGFTGSKEELTDLVSSVRHFLTNAEGYAYLIIPQSATFEILYFGDKEILVIHCS